jgi:cysteine desulfurase
MFFFIKKYFNSLFSKPVYLDHASTTPMDDRVFSVMKKVIKDTYGNPGGMYRLGIETKKVISESRSQIARLLGTTSDHVVFTRGGTESNNIALLGVVSHFKKVYPEIIPHIITSVIEHDSVLEICKHLETTKQVSVSYIPCDADGIIDIAELKKELRPETILVTVMYANNEIGTIQPIREIAKLVRWYKKQLKEKKEGIISESYPLVHTDAIQAVNYCDINIARLGVDMMTISGSKIYGPKSIGVLFVKNRTFIDPTMFGGAQESGLRSGTEDSAMVAGFAKALQISQEIKETEVARLTKIRDFVIHELLKDNRITLNGSQSDRLPNNINITVKGYTGESLVIQLAEAGFAVSSKSACQSDSDEESHVIAALRNANGIIGNSEEGSLRITLGRSTKEKDVKRFLKSFHNNIDKIQ